VVAVQPLVVIVGETGSGKSALAMELAERFNGEIICADSRTVYKGMDIGTAKPSAADQAKIPHHLLDVVRPDQSFTAAEFKRLATKAIADIHDRGRLPIMVGGTGLYIDSVIFDYDFRPPADPERRAELQKLSIEQLQAQLEAEGIPLPRNERNPRHLVRALETGGVPANKQALLPWTLVIGLQVDREELRRRITARVEEMVRAGFVMEVKQLVQKYGEDIEALQAPGYKAFRQYLQGDISPEEARALFIKNDLALAKRQRTWFRRNKSIQWVDDPSTAVELTTTFLNTFQIA
jgi:tRNA dimethylallyltransferase